MRHLDVSEREKEKEKNKKKTDVDAASDHQRAEWHVLFRLLSHELLHKSELERKRHVV